MNPASHPHLSLRLPAWRTRFVVGATLLAFVALSARAFYLQGLNSDFLQAKGESRYSRLLEMSAHRGPITDRHGELLAISTPVDSVWASPAELKLDASQRKALATALDMDVKELNRRIESGEKEFSYLRRHLPADQAAKVVEMGLPGVFLQREFRRYYPAGEVLSHVLGFTDVDDKGQEGLELAHDDWLKGHPGSRRVIIDRRRRIVEEVASIRVPQDGRELALSIDLKLQYLAFRELRNAVQAHQAKAGGIIVLDVKTGELLAVANVPTYNPNNRARYNAVRARNRAITDLFEPGSTLKPFTVATALETGTYRPESVVATAGGSLTIGNRTIRDSHPAGNLTVTQIVQKSSNVGTARMALSMPPQTLWTTLNAAGFGTVPHSGFPGEAAGKLRDYKGWRPIEQATMSYGHGISVSLMQLARAYTIFCGDGELIPLTLVKRDAPVSGISVISPKTATTVRSMLETVTQPGGTATKAQVMGYRVAGKTGTAHKLVNGVYAPDRYASSFVGFAPASDPRLLIAVLIDEPSAGQYYGGQVAAPLFSNVMGAALRMLGVPPDKPVEQKGAPEDVPDIAEEV